MALMLVIVVVLMFMVVMVVLMMMLVAGTIGVIALMVMIMMVLVIVVMFMLVGLVLGTHFFQHLISQGDLFHGGEDHLAIQLIPGSGENGGMGILFTQHGSYSLQLLLDLCCAHPFRCQLFRIQGRLALGHGDPLVIDNFYLSIIILCQHHGSLT